MTSKIKQLGITLAGMALVVTGARAGDPGGSSPLAPDDLDVWCTTNGVFAPNGSTVNPYQSLMAAISRTKTWDESNEVVISTADQENGEPMRIDLPANTIIDTPCTIMKTDPGFGSSDVLIGQQRTRYEVRFLTVNTHLFGTGSDGGIACPPCLGVWAEEERTTQIGGVAMASGAYDVICFQEVWDQDLRDILVSIGAQNGYAFWTYGGEIEGAACLNSGLLLVSKYAIVGAQQYIYEDQAGNDTGSTKGYLRVDVNFPNPAPIITVFTTHTQAGHDYPGIRLGQMDQLADDVFARRTMFPDRPVFVMGDFNVASHSSDCTLTPCWEYSEYMRAEMGSAGMWDGQHNAPDFFDPAAWPHYTADQNNPLYVYFNGSAPSERLDYVLYAGAPIGPENWTIRPDFAQVLPLIGSGIADLGHDFDCIPAGLDTTHLSDHYAVEATFSIYVDE